MTEPLTSPRAYGTTVTTQPLRTPPARGTCDLRWASQAVQDDSLVFSDLLFQLAEFLHFLCDLLAQCDVLGLQCFQLRTDLMERLLKQHSSRIVLKRLREDGTFVIQFRGLFVEIEIELLKKFE